MYISIYDNGACSDDPVWPEGIETDNLTMAEFRTYIYKLSDDDLRRLMRELRFRILVQVTFGSELRERLANQLEAARALLDKRRPLEGH